MLYEDFKERIKDKYLYRSEDEISDYKPDETQRKLPRQQFFRRKLDRRLNLMQNSTTSENCNFVAKNEQGLKTHVRMKHSKLHIFLQGPVCTRSLTISGCRLRLSLYNSLRILI